ncbi:MAG: hypothetical protein HY525_13480 [Betaproteobacteria bacterium]|nr:hypothetical protein [Betaproteobacteria bacterium]
MLIESAFLKLPELLLSNFDHGSEVESTIVHLIGSALQMELNARNIPRPFASVLAEKPYDGIPRDKRVVRADLYVDLTSAIHFDGRMLAYGVRPKNWIEVKAPLSTRRRWPTTLRPDSVTRDCLRLCLFPEQLQGPSTGTETGRYLLWILDSDPATSLAGTSLGPVLRLGENRLNVTARGLSLTASVRTLAFEPSTQEGPKPLFWGYLIRIGKFTATAGEQSFTVSDQPSTGFTQESLEQLRALREVFLAEEEPDVPGA